MKVARVVTIPEAFVHFKPFLKLLKSKGAKVTLISSPGAYEKVLQDELQLGILPLHISRDIKPAKDLKSLFSLFLILAREKFDIVHSSTPKAGLLVAIAGAFFPKTLRVHTFTGQRWANTRGVMRSLLKFLDRLIIRLNTQCYADSFSQIDYLVKEGVARQGEVKCLHKGSYGGIDCGRFNNDRFPAARAELLLELGVEPSSALLLYVGRLTKDKGVDDLVQAFKTAQGVNSVVKLVLIGAYEASLDSLKPETLAEIDSNKSIFRLGFRTNPEKYFSAADLFCMPSYREGFGTVVLEAAACGLSTIGTRIPGLLDAVEDGQTGVLVEVGNTKQLADTILSLVEDTNRRVSLGQKAKQRAHSDFDSEIVSQKQWEEYQKLLKTHL